jgi:hypothetical protein
MAETEAFAADEDQASAGAQSAPTALLHAWKAAVTLLLSRSMRRGSADGPTTATTIENADRLADVLVGVSHAFAGSWSQ